MDRNVLKIPENVPAIPLIVLEALSMVIPFVIIFELDNIAVSGDKHNILFWRTGDQYQQRLNWWERGILFFIITVISLYLVYFILNPILLNYSSPLYKPGI